MHLFACSGRIIRKSFCLVHSVTLVSRQNDEGKEREREREREDHRVLEIIPIPTDPLSLSFSLYVTQRSLLGALSQPARSQSPMQHTEMMTRSPTPISPEKGTPDVPARRDAHSGGWGAGVEEDLNLMEASMLEMAGAHIASGLLEDNAGSARVWEEQEV
jgi:hypothetical protein